MTINIRPVFIWILAIALTSAAGVGCYLYQEQNAQSLTYDIARGIKEADLNVTASRALGQRVFNDLVLLFPNSVKKSQACYQAALSHYVEDQWYRIGRETGCGFLDKECRPHKADPLDIPDPRMIAEQAQLTNIRRNNVFELSGDFFAYLKPITNYFIPTKTPIKSISPDELKVRIAELNKYINNCDALKPIDWSIVGKPFTNDYGLTTASLKLGAYNLLVTNIVGSSLPENKRDYANCLSVYLKTSEDIRRVAMCKNNKSCIETIPVDTKAFLNQRLTELKAHQCSAVYAYEMFMH